MALMVTISSDDTWKKHGFSSLFGVVFAIEHESGKVIDYVVMSEHRRGCAYWKSKSKINDGKKWHK